MDLTVEEYEEIPQYATLAAGDGEGKAGINLKPKLVTITYYYGSGKNQPWLEVPMGITDWTSGASRRSTTCRPSRPAACGTRRISRTRSFDDSPVEFETHGRRGPAARLRQAGGGAAARRDAGHHRLQDHA